MPGRVRRIAAALRSLPGLLPSWVASRIMSWLVRNGASIAPGGYTRLDLGELGRDDVGVATVDPLDDRRGEREVEVHRQLVAARDRRGRAVVGRDDRRVGPVLAHECRLGLDRPDVRRELPPEGVRLRLVDLRQPAPVLDEVAGGVEPEPVDPAREPEGGQALDLGPHIGVADVEVGHPAPRTPRSTTGRRRVLVPGVRSAVHVPRLRPPEVDGAPDVPVAPGRSRPGRRVRRTRGGRAAVVDHEIQDHPDAAAVGLAAQAWRSPRRCRTPG